MNPLIEEVRCCTRCECLGIPFVVADHGGRAFRFPPTIGARGTASLLFVGINPRVSETNREFHNALMRDCSAFVELASNRFQGRHYIGPRGLERHYSAHVRIARQIYPDQAFEAVAAVTELFFCASLSSRGLPLERSPCADRYFERVLGVVQPRVVFALGRAEKYLARRFGTEGGKTFATWADGGRALVIGIPHPNSRGERRSKWDQAAESARSWLFRMNCRADPRTDISNW